MPIITNPQVLIPVNHDLKKWATVACDQFSAEPDYWRTLAKYVGDEPSTLNLVFPEIYIGKQSESQTITSIITHMQTYDSENLFSEPLNAVLVERQTVSGIRKGIVLAVDLESYDWRNLNFPIRATEDTMLDRLAIRVEIRKRAIFETPHTLLLLDDNKKEIIEPIYENRRNLKKIYDFDLNMNGGHITGYSLNDISSLSEKLSALANPDFQVQKYGLNAGIILAVGDGNHSMAAAKIFWDQLKLTLSKPDRINHPARYFLAEMINIYDPSIFFDPIHRIVFGADDDFIKEMQNSLSGEGIIKILTTKGDFNLNVPLIQSDAIESIQKFIEKMLALNSNLKVEYVHNQNHLKKVVNETRGLGISMPAFPKDELFKFVATKGNLPKKSFSIGEPENKRYYLECRRIKY
ncbi:MAG: DUF1015 domain-containing protein [Christensenellaceae bacterium]|jgi:uncharacterized protein (DUF1015 family)|nr:DUF1015 domain-containing protein [Christensenellaceae bacterium]